MSEIKFLRTYTSPDGVEYINCSARPWALGVSFEIRPVRGLKLGEVLDISWVGLTAAGVEMPETKTEITRLVDQDDLDKGYLEETVAEYEKYIKPIRDGSATVSFVVNRDIENPVSASIQVVLINADGEYCPED